MPCAALSHRDAELVLWPPSRDDLACASLVSHASLRREKLQAFFAKTRGMVTLISLKIITRGEVIAHFAPEHSIVVTNYFGVPGTGVANIRKMSLLQPLNPLGKNRGIVEDALDRVGEHACRIEAEGPRS